FPPPVSIDLHVHQTGQASLAHQQRNRTNPPTPLAGPSCFAFLRSTLGQTDALRINTRKYLTMQEALCEAGHMTATNENGRQTLRENVRDIIVRPCHVSLPQMRCQRGASHMQSKEPESRPG